MAKAQANMSADPFDSLPHIGWEARGVCWGRAWQWCQHWVWTGWCWEDGRWVHVQESRDFPVGWWGEAVDWGEPWQPDVEDFLAWGPESESEPESEPEPESAPSP